MKFKKLALLLLVCIFLVGCDSKKNEIELMELKEKESNLSEENSDLKAKISTLEDQIANLESENEKLKENIKKIKHETYLNEDLALEELENFSLSLSEDIQDKMSSTYLNQYNKYFIYDFMKSVVDSGNQTLVEDLLLIINTKADQKEDYNTFRQTEDPLTIAVNNNDISLVRFIAETSPQFIKLVHNDDRGGCQDNQILDYAKTDEMKSLLISLGANTEIDYSDNGWIGKDCIIYNTIEDAENGIGTTGVEGKSIYADERIYILNKNDNQYMELYRLSNFNGENPAYALVSKVNIDPDL